MKYQRKTFCKRTLLSLCSLFLISIACNNKKYLAWQAHTDKPCKKQYTEHLVVSNNVDLNKQKYKIQEDQDLLIYEMKEVIHQKPNFEILGTHPSIWLYNKHDSVVYKTKEFCREGLRVSDTIHVQKWLEDKTVLVDQAYLAYSNPDLFNRLLSGDTLQGIYPKHKLKRWSKDSLNFYKRFTKDRRIEWCKNKAAEMNPPEAYRAIALKHTAKGSKKKYFKWLKHKVVDLKSDKPSNRVIYYKIKGRDTLKSAFKNAQLRSWLFNRIGEKPTVYDSTKTARSLLSMRNYLRRKGYHDATVKSSVIYKKHKAFVSYRVTTRKPVLIDTVIYESADTALLKLLQTTQNKRASLLQAHQPIDNLLFEKEKIRIRSFIQNKGYQLFDRNHISYEADTIAPKKRKPEKRKFLAPGKHWEQGEPRATVYVKINRYATEKELLNHTAFTIRNVYIYPREITRLPYESTLQLDSIFIVRRVEEQELKKQASRKYNYHYDRRDIASDEVISKIILYKTAPDGKNNKERDYLIKHLTLCEAVRINTGDRYTEDAKKETIHRLSRLDVFNLPRVEFVPSASGKVDELDCYVRMKPSDKQVVGFDLEGNSNNSNLGVALSFVYKNRNFFKGGEIFASNLEGGVDFMLGSDSTRLTGNSPINLLDLNGEVKLYFPRFLPFQRLPNTTLNPRSEATLGANYSQQSGYFSLLNFYSKFGYNYSARNKVGTHLFEFNPFILNFTPGATLSSSFEERLTQSNQALYKSLTDAYFIPSLDFSYTLTTPENERNAWFVKVYVESAGLLWYAVDKVSLPSDTFKVAGISYSQYIKFDLDLRYSLYLGRKHSLASRLMAGLVVPYLNASQMPFARRFHVGGTNSMRAWRMRHLGAGRVKPGQGTAFQLGDIRIEMNLEYRLKLNSWIGFALFVDAGNVWVWKNEQITPNLPYAVGETGVFSKNFLKELGLGLGVGLRLDFTFIIVRIDLAMQVHNPAGFGEITPAGQLIYWNANPFRRGAQNFILAVGYPF